MKKYRDEICRVMIAVNEIDGVYYQWSRSQKLKINMLTVLYALNDGKSYTQQQLSNEWLIPKTTVNTIVKECIEKGYMEMERMEGTREKKLYLTEAGKKYADEALKEVYDAEEAAMVKTLEKYPADQWIPALEYFYTRMREEYEKSRKDRGKVYDTKHQRGYEEDAGEEQGDCAANMERGECV